MEYILLLIWTMICFWIWCACVIGARADAESEKMLRIRRLHDGRVDGRCPEIHDEIVVRRNK